MKIILPDRDVRIFSVLRRAENEDLYRFDNMTKLIQLSDAFEYAGILLFQNNKADIDPWFFCQMLLNQSRQLSPFIAINPVYMHPFTTARMLYSISTYYQRKIFLNFIIGTSKSDQLFLGDTLNHAQRYERLSEFMLIFDHLLQNPAPLTFSGNYYTVCNLTLSARLPESLQPGYFIAGSSDNAMMLKDQYNAVHLQMAKRPSQVTNALSLPAGRAVHFGVVTAPTSDEARKHFETAFFRKTGEAEINLAALLMENTDAVWKKNLLKEAANTETDSCYCLVAFSKGASDCPYLVGSYTDVAAAIVQYISQGISDIVIEIQESGEAFAHVDKMLEEAKHRLLQLYQRPNEAFEFSF